MLAVSCIDWLGVGVAKQGKHGLRNFCIGARTKATNVSTPALPASFAMPQARERAPAAQRLQLSAGVADSAEVRITPPRRSAVASLTYRAERKLSPQLPPSQRKCEQQLQSAARTKHVLSAADGLADTRRSNRRTIARCAEPRVASVFTRDAEVT